MKVKFTVSDRYAIADVYKEHEGYFPWQDHEPKEETFQVLKALWERMDKKYMKEVSER